MELNNLILTKSFSSFWKNNIQLNFDKVKFHLAIFF